MASKIFSLGYYKENPVGSGTAGTYGVTPNASINATATAAAGIRVLRLVDDTIDTELTRQESNEVRFDAQSSGSIITDATAGGPFNLQWSLQTYDDLIPGLLYAADDGEINRDDGWASGGFAAGTEIMTGSVAAPVTWDFDLHKFVIGTGSWNRQPIAGEKIYVRGFSNRNLDTVWEVESASPTDIIPLNDTGAANVSAYAGVTADITTATAVLIQGVWGYSRNATNERSFGVIKFFSDISLAGTTGTGSGPTSLSAVDWSNFRGEIPVSLQLSASPGQAGWTGSMSFLGKDEVPISDATVSTQGFQIANYDRFRPATSVPLVNTLQNVVCVRLRKFSAVAAVIGDFTRVDPLSMAINMTNGATPVNALRNLGAVQIQQGTFSATIDMSLIYVNKTFHVNMLADLAYEVEVGLADAEGNCQLWRYPKCRFTNTRPNPGKNQVAAEQFQFTAEANGNGMAYTTQLVVGATTQTDGKMVEVLRFYPLT